MADFRAFARTPTGRVTIWELHLLFADTCIALRVNYADCRFYSKSCTSLGSIWNRDHRSCPSTSSRASATVRSWSSQIELDELHVLDRGGRLAPRNSIERTPPAQEDTQQKC